MPRSELLVTIAGLLGTFMLPWPGEPARSEDAARMMAASQRPACTDTHGPRVARRDVQPPGGV